MANLRFENAALVYQSGIANVFEVLNFTYTGQAREARRLYQGDFRGAALYATALGAAGVVVRTSSCNVAGDCAEASWTLGTEGTPFHEQAQYVNRN